MEEIYVISEKDTNSSATGESRDGRGLCRIPKL